MLEPTANEVSYKVLEVAVNLSQVPLTDKLGLHQCIGDMLRDEVMKLALDLRKLEDKYKEVVDNLKKERKNSRGVSNNLHHLRKIMSEKGSDKEGIRTKIIRDLEVENSELKKRLKIP